MKRKININKPIAILFVLIGLVLMFNILLYTGTLHPISEQWTCSQYTCDKMTTAQDWINQNCFISQDGTNKIMCNVIMNNKPNIIPLDMINQDSLNQCTEARCIQEVKTREANYKVDVKTLKPLTE